MGAKNTPCLRRHRLDGAGEINTRLIEEFIACRDAKDIRRTHLFKGRYENIYVGLSRMPSLGKVLSTAREYAAQDMGCTKEQIQLGFWLNAMNPGDVTLPHTHDDDDEALSGVYYINTPADSGDLILRADGEDVRVSPEAGVYVFFAPDLEHEVSEHRGQGLRLSIGMNFGIA